MIKTFKINILLKKFLLIALIIIGLLFGLNRVEQLTTEREDTMKDTKNSVARSWREPHIIGDVILNIPYKHVYNELVAPKKYKKVVEIGHIKIFPKYLDISIKTKTVNKKRGIYKVPLYTSDIELKGHFNVNKYLKLKFDVQPISTEILWKQAQIQVGTHGTKGIEDISLNWNNSKPIRGFIPSKNKSLGGISFNKYIDLNQDSIKNSFNITLKNKGSQYIEINPSSENTNIQFTSDWPSPSFKGDFLPDNSQLTKNGSSASWDITNVSEYYSRPWYNEEILTGNYVQKYVKINLFQQQSAYSLLTRAIKYGFLLIILSFSTLFLIEILLKFNFHPIQYLLTGGALTIFYLILLSFSEQFGFGISYLVSAIVAISTISLYILGISSSKKSTIIVASQLSILYAILYTILVQKNYTLIVGSVVLWLYLVIIMYSTRKINWFKINTSAKTSE